MVGKLRTAASKLTSRQGFIGLMLMASVALSVASYYTTFDGMTQYMDIVWVTMLITFGLQATMFALSWIIAQLLGTGASRIALGLLIFGICATVSIFFSFASLFSGIFNDEMRDNANAGVMRDGYQEIAGSLSTRLREAQSELHGEIVESPEFTVWLEGVRTVSRVAEAVPELFRERRETARAALDTEIRGLEAERSAVEQALETLGSQGAGVLPRDVLSRQLEEATTQLLAIDGQIATLTADIGILQSNMDAEREGVGAQAGEGPRFRAFRDERDVKLRERNTLEATKSVTEDRIALLSDQLQKAGASAATMQSERARLEASLQTLERDLAEKDAERAGLDEIQAPDPARVIAEQQELLAELTRTPVGFGEKADQVVALCEGLLREMRGDAALLAEIGSAGCTPEGALGNFSRLEARETARVRFEADCDPTSVPVPAEGETIFAATVQKIGSCISISGLVANTERAALNTLISTRGPDAHPFIVAQNSLFRDRQPLAYMSFAIAFVIDVLILLAALLANFAGASRRARALQALLNVEFETGPDGVERPFVPVNRSVPYHRFLEQEANRLQFQGVGRLDRSQGKLYLLLGAREYIDEQIRHESGEAVLSTARPASTGRPQRKFP